MIGMNDMGRVIAISFLSGAFLAAFTANTTVLAQAGSTGGSIGKTEKSLSGGNYTQIPERPSSAAPKPKRKPSRVLRPAAVQSCEKFIGTWSWIAGHTIIFKPGGVMKSLPEGTAGTWSCLGGMVRVVWDNGFVDHDSISPDGTRILGTNQYGNALSGARQ